jgi:glutamate-1-semialdehyde 2,1-aminomutase
MAQDTFISSTNWTERIGPTAALATLEKLQREMPFEHLADLGKGIVRVWKESAAAAGVDISTGGIAPMSHFTFAQHHEACKALFVESMLERQILASTLFYAMTVHTEQDVERYAKAAAAAFNKIAVALDSGDPASRLKGSPAAKGFSRLA